MRNIVSYFFAGAFVVLLLDAIVPPAGLVLGPLHGHQSRGSYWRPRLLIALDKGDRLLVPKASGRRLTPPAAPVLVGCDPVFSSLSKDHRPTFRAVALPDVRLPTGMELVVLVDVYSPAFIEKGVRHAQAIERSCRPGGSGGSCDTISGDGTS